MPPLFGAGLCPAKFTVPTENFKKREYEMDTVKTQAKQILDHLPDEATWEDLMQRIYVRQMIEAGIRDADAGRVQDVGEVRRAFGLPE
jgi:hypothetical protein